MNRALARVGYVTRSRADLIAVELKQALKDLKRAQADVASLTLAIEQARADARAWKDKVEDAGRRRAADNQDEAVRWRGRVEKAVADAEARLAEAHGREIQPLHLRLEKADRDLARWREHDEQRTREFKEMKAKLTAAGHDLQLAREHLMLMETKLEVVDAGINTLDARLRATQPAGSGV